MIEEEAEHGMPLETEHTLEQLAPLRTTIDSTAEAAKQAAYRSGRVLELMTAGSGGYDPIEVLGDAVFQVRHQLDRVEAKIDTLLELMRSGTRSPPSVPTPPKPGATG